MSAVLVILVVLGGVGLFLAMPREDSLLARAGGVLLVGAGAAVLALVLPTYEAGPGRPWFIVLTVVVLGCATRVITHKRPVYSALYFILMIFGVACMLVLMRATFVAAALLAIYAGAILVTYLFVIMLAQQGGSPARYDTQAREPLLGVIAGFVLLAVIAGALTNPPTAVQASAADSELIAGTVEPIAELLLTRYVIAVEIAGLLLLAAMVGAVAIARRQSLAESPMEGA